MTQQSFGEIIRAARIEKGWTATKLKQKLSNLVSTSWITRLENYGELPSPTLLCQLARALDLDREQLLERLKVEKVSKYALDLDRKYKRALKRYDLRDSMLHNC